MASAAPLRQGKKSGLSQAQAWAHTRTGSLGSALWRTPDSSQASPKTLRRVLLRCGKMFNSSADQLWARPDAKLDLKFGGCLVHGAETHIEPTGDLLVRPALCDERQNLPLPRKQSVNSVGIHFQPSEHQVGCKVVTKVRPTANDFMECLQKLFRSRTFVNIAACAKLECPANNQWISVHGQDKNRCPFINPAQPAKEGQAIERPDPHGKIDHDQVRLAFSIGLKCF